MTLNYIGRCKAVVERGEVRANSKPHLWPRRGCNCYNQGRGRRFSRADLCPPPLSVPSFPSWLVCYTFPLLYYLALTLLRGNLLINSQLVSAARRLINRRRVARWRHAQNPLSKPRRDLCVRVILKHPPLPLLTCSILPDCQTLSSCHYH